jgi:hypothetical protein
VKPGRATSASGLHDGHEEQRQEETRREHESAAERAVTLLDKAIDVLVRSENAPRSPLFAFLTAEKRRELRRNARRLRRQQAAPRYRNLHTAEELAGIYERTAQRDEIFERSHPEYNRISSELGLLLEKKDPEMIERVESYVRELHEAALEQGPSREAAQRYRQWQLPSSIATPHRPARPHREPGPPARTGRSLPLRDDSLG